METLPPKVSLEIHLLSYFVRKLSILQERSEQKHSLFNLDLNINKVKYKANSMLPGIMVLVGSKAKK